MADEGGAELDGHLHERILTISQRADELAEQHSYYDALIQYNDALALLPEPKTSWEASTWLLGSIGDAAFLGGYHPTARDALEDVMACPGALGNPFLHLRLGQVHLELGNEARALDELTRAYMGAGVEIFANEDPKYLTLLQEHKIL